MHACAYAPFPSSSGLLAFRFVLSGPERVESIYPCYALFRPRRGALGVGIEGRQSACGAGQGIVLPPFEVVTLAHEHPETTVDGLLVPAEIVDDAVVAAAGRRLDAGPFVHQSERLLSTLDGAHEVFWRAADTVGPDGVESIVARELAAALVELGAAQRRRRASPIVHQAREVIDRRYAEHLPLDELASQVGVSKYHLLRQFRRQVGMAPHAYQLAVRIARSRELLAHGVSAAHVADRVGFYDQSALTRAFKRAAGITPGAYAALVCRRPSGVRRAHPPTSGEAECGS